MFAARRATATKADGSSLRHFRPSQSSANLPMIGKSVAEAAKELGVSERQVTAAKTIRPE